jgi:hypothetical protein
VTDVAELRDPTGLDVAGKLEALSDAALIVAALVVWGTVITEVVATAELEAIEELDAVVPGAVAPPAFEEPEEDGVFWTKGGAA